jgi:hypothetical protein
LIYEWICSVKKKKKAAAGWITCRSREGCSVLSLIIVSAIAMDNDFLFEKGGAGRSIYLLDWFLVTKFSWGGIKQS